MFYCNGKCREIDGRKIESMLEIRADQISDALK